MKKLLFLGFLFAFLSFANISLAESYPASCPTEAQSVLKAVGGCSTIDSNTYSNIYTKCCVKVAPTLVSTSTSTSTNTSTPIIYVLIAVIVAILIVWQILRRKK